MANRWLRSHALDQEYMDHLDKLENQSVFIIREAFNKIERLIKFMG